MADAISTVTAPPMMPPPLAVVAGAARTLATSGAPNDRLRQLCAYLCNVLPARSVTLRPAERREQPPVTDVGAPALSVEVPWRDDRSAILEVVDSSRPPAELRPIVQTIASMLAALLPSFDQDTAVVPDVGAVERRLHRLTIDSLPVGLYVVDRDYRIVLWNRKRETGTQGLRRQDVIGRTVLDVLTGQPADQLRREFDGVFSSGDIHESEQDVPTGSEHRTYRTTRLPMRVEGMEVSHVITIGEDVTETRAMQRAMHQTEKLAAVGQLAAGVMHEINNPLATIGACVAAITTRLGRGAEPVVREYLDIIESEVERCTGIVDGLLDFSRAGRSRGDAVPTDLNALLDRTLYLLKHHQRFRRLTVSREFAESLPMVIGNEERLIQAAMAILLNAADASSGHGNVVVRTRFENQCVVAEFHDDGPGIRPDVLPKIFEPFFTTKGPGRGTGLGLAIAYGIVSDYQGRLDVRSEPGNGTLFRMALAPAKEAAT